VICPNLSTIDDQFLQTIRLKFNFFCILKSLKATFPSFFDDYFYLFCGLNELKEKYFDMSFFCDWDIYPNLSFSVTIFLLNS